MFGYVRAFKPYMRMCEYDTYKGVYCGLCKTMGKEFGLASRFTLSYDFTFLALVNMSVNRVAVTAEKQRCIAHPLKKSACVTCTQGLSYPAYSAVILVYHKLRDDLADRGIKGKLAAFFTIPFFKRPYKKARIKYPNLANTIEDMMKLQSKVEKEKTQVLDMACEPTARIMEAIFSEITDDENLLPVLKRFGYLLGRYIYICDALDDAKDDFKNGGYNPLLYKCDVAEYALELPQDEYRKLCDYAAESIDFTLGELAVCYDKLGCEMYKPILDNIIYLGLKNVYEQIRDEKLVKKEK